MGRKPEPGKQRWKGHITRGRSGVRNSRQDLEELRAFIRSMRDINAGDTQGGKFLDAMASVIDRLGGHVNDIETEFIGLLEIITLDNGASDG